MKYGFEYKHTDRGKYKNRNIFPMDRLNLEDLSRVVAGSESERKRRYGEGGMKVERCTDAAYFPGFLAFC